MSEADQDRDPLELLATEFTERQRRGESPSISEYTTRYPELAAEIQDLFPAIATMERLKVHKEQGSAPRASLGTVRLERLGDFRIISEIGRGGMGIVYEAFQESLDRHVAVKVLPKQSLLDEKQLQRFHREAQTAARLHHTNIVPVFGVGEHQGFHYIVMQLIRGVGLDAVLAALRQRASVPTAPRNGQNAARQPLEHGRDTDIVSLIEALVTGQGWQTRESTLSSPQLVETAVSSKEEIPSAAEKSSSPVSVATESLHVDHDTKVNGSHEDASASRETSTVPAQPLQLGPLYWRSTAKIALQVAEAIQYAHLQNTLHRDIKPANLLLDSQGVIWVTDFGLAKAMEQNNVTQTGAIVGTLRYMAPEQLSAQSDARSDIYSLGLTLYELLTLQPVFEDTSRSGLIWKIMHQEPSRPRKLDPEIPRDLETIVLKSIAREPAARYQSAREMAEDLRRFLDDRPVAARRITPPERLWRWCRRNPVVAGLTSAVLAMVVVAAMIATIGYAQTRRAWMGESQQRQKAEATTELAMEALDKIFHQFAPNRITDAAEISLADAEGDTVDVPIQPVISKETAAVLERMLEFYGQLGEQGGNNTKLRSKVADATRRVGDIRQRLGHYQEATAAYQRAIVLYRKMQRQSPDEIELLTQIASVYNELGKVYRATEDEDNQRRSHSGALAVLAAAQSQSHVSPGLRYELARTYYLMSRKGASAPKPPPPPPSPGEAPPERRSDPARFGPFPPKPPLDGAARETRSVPGRPGDLRPGPDSDRRKRPPADGEAGPRQPRPTLDPPPQQENMQKAIDLLEELVDQHPSIPEYRHLLAQCYRDMHPVAFIFSREAALEANDKAIEILEALVRDFPDVADFRYALSQTYADSPPPDRESFLSGDFASIAEKRFRKALKISEELVTEHPNIPEFAASQAEILFKLAETLRRAGQVADAQEFLRKSLDLQSSLARRFPDVLGYAIQMTRLEFELARLLREVGEQSAARSLLESSTAKLQELTEIESTK
ncbi:MAG: hypothetical protein A2V70_16570, partial [Planctomycetes bacterium RBG_13_63_9]